MTVTGELFPPGKVKVWAVPERSKPRILLGEVDVDRTGKWTLSFELEPEMTGRPSYALPTDETARVSQILAEFDRWGHGQGFSVCRE